MIKLQDRQDIGLLDDQNFLSIDGHLGAGVFAIKDDVSDLDFHRFVLLAGACRHDGALLGLFLGFVRDEDA